MNVSNWEPPIPLEYQDLPEFPVELLPNCLRDYARSIAGSLEVPLDLPANLMLAALSAAVSRGVEVQVNPDWIEPVNLYIAVALPPGERKSPVYKKIVSPIEYFEEELIERVKQENVEIQKKRSIKEAEIEDQKKAINKAKGERKRELRWQLEAMQDDLQELYKLPQLMADDVTPEKLATLLENNRGCISIMSSEGGVFSMISGRYSNGEPNLDIYLKSHDSESIRVDRIGRDPVLIKNARLTMGLTVQPEVLKQLNKKSEIRGRGLTARFLFSLPIPKAGFRKHMHRIIDDGSKQHYEKTLINLLQAIKSNSGEAIEPINLVLSNDALEELIAFQMLVETMIRPGGKLDHAKDWASKLPGKVIRLAALLHCSDNPHLNIKNISVSTMNRATGLATYFIEHYIATLELIGADPDIEIAKKIFEWIQREQMDIFSERDAHQALRGSYQKKQEILPGFSVLMDRGYIQELATTAQSKGRKPSARYIVNPLVMQSSEPNHSQATC